jgi:polyhydroxybutyrate depolymerase
MSTRPWWALALALAVLVAACGADRRSATAAPAQGPEPAGCPGAGTSEIEGAVLRMPAGAREGATPLIVVVIPGGGGDTTDRLGIARAANRRGIAVVYPTSEGSGFWTLNDRQGSADVEDVRGLLDRLQATGCFDAARISITGVSNGAGFAARMACELPGRFAAVVPVAAGYRALDPCPASARTSFLAIHGTGDTVVPYNGRKPDRKGSVPRYTAGWARRDGCAGRRATSPRRLVTRYTWRRCDDGLRVELLRLTGTEHGWPGSTGERRPGNPSGLRATAELLRFVAGARRS